MVAGGSSTKAGLRWRPSQGSRCWLRLCPKGLKVVRGLNRKLLIELKVKVEKHLSVSRESSRQMSELIIKLFYVWGDGSRCEAGE